MKKFSFYIFIILIVFTITGCECNHKWVDATCITPKTCSKCGLTEGNPLGHKLAPANYQAGQVCEACGEVIGEPIKGSFETYNLNCNCSPNEVYSYTSICHTDESKITTGKYEIESVECIDDSSLIYADMTPVEGYEWIKIRYHFSFDDQMAQKYGYTYGIELDDYYDVDLMDSSRKSIDKESIKDPYFSCGNFFTVNYNGVNYTKCRYLCHNENLGWNNHVVNRYGEYYVLIPKGYDGIVLSTFNYKNIDLEHIYDKADSSSIFYRFIHETNDEA